MSNRSGNSLREFSAGIRYPRRAARKMQTGRGEHKPGRPGLPGSGTGTAKAVADGRRRETRARASACCQRKRTPANGNDIREMGEAELRRSREGEPTIDRIIIAEFETAEEQREWLKARAPAFIRKQE